MIRLTKPSIDEADIESVQEVLESGFLVQGKFVSKFEVNVSKYVGTNYAIAVSNCTAALHLSLLSVGIKSGDSVVLPAYSFPATANAVEIIGARPIFIDIEPETYNIDPDHLDEVLEKFSKGTLPSKIKAIIPVHAFGQMADMHEISRIAELHNLPIIEDAACALGAKQNDKPAGKWGILGCFSFHPRKAITTGEGGIVATDNPKIADYIRAMRNHGLDPKAEYSDFILPGFNYRMTDFQGALGLSQFKKLDRIITARRKLAFQYSEAFRNTPIEPAQIKHNNFHIFQSYVVQIPPEIENYRDNLIDDLRKNGIETTIGTWHIPMTSYYKNKYGYGLNDFPVTDSIFRRSLSLPLFESLTNENQNYVIEQLLLSVEKIL